MAEATLPVLAGNAGPSNNMDQLTINVSGQPQVHSQGSPGPTILE